MADEEKTGFRACNILAALGLRGMPLPEMNHGKWNDHLRAIETAGLGLAKLKATLLANFGGGPFHSGRFRFTIQKAAQQLMSTASDEFLVEVCEQIAWDLGVPHETFVFTRDDWMNSPGIRTRIKEVPQT